MNSSRYTELLGAIKDCQTCELLLNEKLSSHTTFRIGGAADFFVLPQNIPTFCMVLDLVAQNEIPYKVIGNASNLLIHDNGFRGVVIQTKPLDCVSLENGILRAECGATLARCARKAAEAGLSGFEKIAGIPATIGGALAMNAGAYGSQIADILRSVSVFDMETRSVYSLNRDELAFGYRTALISDRRYIALSAEFCLQERSREEILTDMRDCMERRQSSQPLNYPSAGSVFKRPPNDYAGRLIEAAGLKGTRIGDAEVSEKHAGFIINRGHATSEDVRALIALVQRRVRETSDVLLVCEIEILPEG